MLATVDWPLVVRFVEVVIWPCVVLAVVAILRKPMAGTLKDRAVEEAEFSPTSVKVRFGNLPVPTAELLEDAQPEFGEIEEDGAASPWLEYGAGPVLLRGSDEEPKAHKLLEWLRGGDEEPAKILESLRGGLWRTEPQPEAESEGDADSDPEGRREPPEDPTGRRRRPPAPRT